jgi:hypothetical protein
MFLYYQPDGESPPGYAFDGPPPCTRACLRGPDGGKGVTLGASADGLGYYPDRQTWRKLPESNCWVGCDTLPGPRELRRARQLPGVPVQLGDGNEWTIPYARRFVESDDVVIPVCALPRCREMGDDGKWGRGEVVGKYKPLWQIATEAWDAFGGEATSEEWECQACAVVLAANYRVSETEISMLGLFDDLAVVSILKALTDIDTFIDWNKKKQQHAAQNGLCGVEGATRDSVLL